MAAIQSMNATGSAEVRDALEKALNDAGIPSTGGSSHGSYLLYVDSEYEVEAKEVLTQVPALRNYVIVERRR